MSRADAAEQVSALETKESESQDYSHTLAVAIKDGKADEVERLLNRKNQSDLEYLKKCISLSDYGYDIGVSPLHFATWFDNPAVITCIGTKFPGLVNLADEFEDAKLPHLGGQTPLYWAAENNKPRNMTALIALGADPLTPDDRGNTPAHIAAKMGFKGCLEVIFLSERGGVPAITTRNKMLETPIMLALERQQKACYDYLHDCLELEKAKKAAAEEKGEEVVSKGESQAVESLTPDKSLLSHSVLKKLQRQNPEKIEIYSKHYEAFQEKYRDAFEFMCTLGESELKKAIEAKNEKRVKELLDERYIDLGRCINILSEGHIAFVPALHFATWFENNGKIIALLHEKDPSYLNTPDDCDGQAPLYWAIENNKPDNARKLIALGANVNQRDRYGNTPLHVAAKYGFIDCINALLESPQIDRLCLNNASQTAKEVAIENSRPEIVGLLDYKKFPVVSREQTKDRLRVLHRTYRLIKNSQDSSNQIILYLLLSEIRKLEKSLSEMKQLQHQIKELQEQNILQFKELKEENLKREEMAKLDGQYEAKFLLLSSVLVLGLTLVPFSMTIKDKDFKGSEFYTLLIGIITTLFTGAYQFKKGFGETSASCCSIFQRRTPQISAPALDRVESEQEQKISSADSDQSLLDVVTETESGSVPSTPGNFYGTFT